MDQDDIRTFPNFSKFKFRFTTYLEKDRKEDDCWNWKGALNNIGYGKIYWRKKHYVAHRASYLIYNGPILEGKIVMHICDNRRCVNPKHLIIGNHHNNSTDMVKRNRQGSQQLNEEVVKVIKYIIKNKSKYSHGLISKLARLHKVSHGTISDIAKNRSWAWVQV